MLLKFSVENFRSIKDKATLSMVATEDKSNDVNIIYDTPNKIDVLPCAEIYGANGSGKSSILKAMKEMISLMLEDFSDKNLPASPHCKRMGEPTTLECFITNGIDIFQYNISFTKESLLSERLVCYDLNNHETELFFSDGEKITFSTDIVFCTELVTWKTKESVLSQIHSLREKQDNDLAERNFDKLLPVFSFAEEFFFTNDISNFSFRYECPDEYRRIFKAININGMKPEYIEKLNFLFKNSDNTPLVYWLNECGIPAKGFGFLGENVPAILYDGGVIVPISDESEGTIFVIKLFEILSLLESEFSGILCIDEIESHMHPMLVKKIVEGFQKYSTLFKTTSQLIFSTHNAELLDLSLVRKDQIWFTEIHSNERATELYSLAEFKDVDQSTDIHTWYLEGCYGGIPKFEDVKNGNIR